MTESLVLFESVINSRWFSKTSIILFLNKIDVLKTKLPKVGLYSLYSLFLHILVSQVPLERYFPEYSGGADINKAAKYILYRFMQTNHARLLVYPQCVPSLCVPLFNSCHCMNQSNTSNGHHEHSFSLCGSKGNHPTECA